jgi:hypothetical protein
MMAVGIPVLVTYGLIYPRADDLYALNLRPNEIALLVGVQSSNSHFGATGSSAGEGRTYIVIPRAFSDPEMLDVTTLDGRNSVQSNEGGAIVVLLIWIACAYVTWRFLVAPVSRHLTMRWSGP